MRKLYHPEQFPNASVLPIFDRVFSQAPRPGVCAVGFEPNPKHSAYLGTVNAWFRRRGYPAHIFRETAVGKSKGNVTFYSAGPAELDMAASFARVPRFQGHTIINFNVTVISLVDFITKVVRPILDAEERATGRRPPVAMKLDIEVRLVGAVAAPTRALRVGRKGDGRVHQGGTSGACVALTRMCIVGQPTLTPLHRAHRWHRYRALAGAPTHTTPPLTPPPPTPSTPSPTAPCEHPRAPSMPWCRASSCQVRCAKSTLPSWSGTPT